MYKILILVLTASVAVQAQSPSIRSSKKPTKRELMIAKIEAELNTSEVFDILRRIRSGISKADKAGTPLTYRQYAKYEDILQSCAEYRWFIADTGLSKKWIKDIYKLIKYMRNIRNIIETEIRNGHTALNKYKQAEQYFDVAYKRFLKLSKKPVKVSNKVRRKSKLKKALWQKAMRKKYKIKQKIQTVEF